MPIVQFNVSGPTLSDTEVRGLLEEASGIYAKVLDCPLDRVRAFYLPHGFSHAAAHGKVTHERVVFFEFIVLEGRSVAQRQQLAQAFTEIVARLLDVDTALVRGRCVRVAPEDWCIGGRFASDLRQAEIEARKDS